MARQLIKTEDVRRTMYFSWHYGEGLVLYTPNESFNLSVAAGEDLLENLRVNVEYARKAAEELD